MREKICDHADDFAGEQHSRFHRVGPQFGEDSFDLLSDHVGANRLNPRDAFWILRRDAGDGAGAVNTQGGERFQVRLNARAAAAVRAGDG